MDAVFEWPFDDDAPPTTWIQQGDRFLGVVVNGATRTIGEDDFDAARPKRHASGRTDCVPWLPNAFERCPFCGDDLVEVINAEPRESGPIHVPEPGIDALPIPKADSIKPLDLPDGRDFFFGRFGRGGVAFLFARDPGRIYRFSRTANTFVSEARTPSTSQFETPHFAMSVGAQSGLAPSNDGLCRLSVGADGTIRADLVEGAQAVGGAAFLNGRHFAPVIHDGRLAIATVPDNATDIAFMPAANAPEDPGLLARPLHAGGFCFWSGLGGHLTLDLELDTATWRGWKPNFKPVLAQRPIQCDDGLAWQFGALQSEGRSRAGYERLTIDLMRADQHEVDGARFGDGAAFFAGRARLRPTPWAVDDVRRREYPIAEDDFIYPVAAIGEQAALIAVAKGRAQATLLAEDAFKDDPKGLRAELAYSPEPGRIERLGKIIYLKRPGQIWAARHQNRLIAYDAVSNEAQSWAFESR